MKDKTAARIASRLSAVMGQRVTPRAASRFAFAVCESARRREDRPVLARPFEVYALLRNEARARTERLVGLYLDAQNQLLDRRVLTVGSLNITRTQPREILWPAIGSGAHGIILAHNHPSGCLDPSEEDVAFTQAIARACEVCAIDLYDHLIIARGGYTSLRERGVL